MLFDFQLCVRSTFFFFFPMVCVFSTRNCGNPSVMSATGSGRGGSSKQAKLVVPDVRLPGNISPTSSGGIPEHSGQMGYIYNPSCELWVLSQLAVPGGPPQGGFQLNQMPASPRQGEMELMDGGTVLVWLKARLQRASQLYFLFDRNWIECESLDNVGKITGS